MKLIIHGIGGKVGQIIMAAALKDESIELIAGIDKFADCSQFDVPVFKSFDDCNLDADVIVDFSRPEALDSILKFALAHKTNIVFATTGFTESQQKQIDDASKEIAIFQASNMTLGVNLLVDISKQAAKFLGEEYDIEIIEQHHNMKVDSPSGTALYIADEINNVFDNSKFYKNGRDSKNEKRQKSEIGIHAVRGGTIVGKHDVMFIGADEVITITHEAQSRHVFAVGSLRAGKYICDKSFGKYSMDNILGKDYAVTTVSSTGDTNLIGIENISSKDFSTMLKELSDNGVNLDMISRMINQTGSNSVSFTVQNDKINESFEVLKNLNIDFHSKENCAKLLIAGAGMVHECGVAEEVFTQLHNIDVDVFAVTTSETEISCCISLENKEKAEKALRNYYKVTI